MINSALKKEFLDLIQSHTGIKLRAQDWGTLAEKIVSRIRSLKLPDAHAYYQHLVVASQNFAVRSKEDEQEWNYFLDLITIGESYFFRDRDQFDLLREQILPDLIEQQRLAYATGSIPQLALSLWSAGCSSGEEAYSLAILLKDLIPDYSEWQISILGTDLNLVSIDRARQGIYRNWSFRQTKPRLKSNYFDAVSTGWQIHNSIRQRVTFRYGNLLHDPLPQAMLNNLHLIICRNVFIYFDAVAIAKVLSKFHTALSPDGYLITGHAELFEQNLEQFQVLSLPGSIVYKRQAVMPVALSSQNQRPAPLTSPKSSNAARSRPSSTFLVTDKPVLKTEMNTQYRFAKFYSQKEDWEQAMHYCQAALQFNEEALPPLYLKAQIAKNLGDHKQAKTIYKKILYLQPIEIPAYLELGTLYQQEAQKLRAEKMYRAAQDLLQQLPAESCIDYQGQVTAGLLSAQLRKLLLDISKI